VFAVRKEAAKGAPQVETVLSRGLMGEIFLRVDIRSGGICQFSYSQDGEHFIEAGGPFTATVGRWVGAKTGLFASGNGHADFDWFHVSPP
jgi:hypothetical protein